MSDWIKVRAAGIRLAEEERKAERNRQMDATKALKAKVEPFWNELVGVLQDSVKEFNAEFPAIERQIDHFIVAPVCNTSSLGSYGASKPELSFEDRCHRSQDQHVSRLE